MCRVVAVLLLDWAGSILRRTIRDILAYCTAKRSTTQDHLILLSTHCSVSGSAGARQRRTMFALFAETCAAARLIDKAVALAAERAMRNRHGLGRCVVGQVRLTVPFYGPDCYYIASASLAFPCPFSFILAPMLYAHYPNTVRRPGNLAVSQRRPRCPY